MADTTIHDVSAEAFHKMDLSDKIDFLAEVAAPWVDAGEDGSLALPPTYSILFERRVAQAAKQHEVGTGDVFRLLIEEAEAILGDNDGEDEAPKAKPARKAAKPKAKAAPKVEAPAPVEDAPVEAPAAEAPAETPVAA